MSSIPTKTQVSAGGVVYRKQDNIVEVVLISVGRDNRWQLPKGLVNRDEAPEVTALREVREETGLNATLIEQIDKIEYWYFSKERGERVRFHKFVYFYLMRCESGDTTDHDHEVNEARWVALDDAQAMLAFKNEQKVVEQAKAMIAAHDR